MTEVTYTACHVANLVPGRGRGLKLLGLDLTVTDTYTLTTGLSEISGMGHMLEDAAVDAQSLYAVVAISGGTITWHTEEIDDAGGGTTSANAIRAIVMGVVR